MTQFPYPQRLTARLALWAALLAGLRSPLAGVADITVTTPQQQHCQLPHYAGSQLPL